MRYPTYVQGSRMTPHNADPKAPIAGLWAPIQINDPVLPIPISVFPSFSPTTGGTSSSLEKLFLNDGLRPLRIEASPSAPAPGLPGPPLGRCGSIYFY